MGKKADYSYLLNTYHGNYYVIVIIYKDEHEKKLAAQEDTRVRFEADPEALSSKQHESFYRGTTGARKGQFKPYDDDRPWCLVKCDCGSMIYWMRVDNLIGKHSQSCPLCKNRPRNEVERWKKRTPGTPINYARINNLTGETFGELFVLGPNKDKTENDSDWSHTWYDVIDPHGNITVRRRCELREINS